MSEKHPRDMTDDELAEAERNHVWRSPADPAKSAAPPKPALSMTDEQFSRAVHALAWRKPKETP